jgi:hypothetical protein
MRVQRRRRDRTAAARDRGASAPSQLLPSARKLLEELVRVRKRRGNRPGCPLGGVPRPEVLDDGLRVHMSLGILRELPHGRRPRQTLGGPREARRDLLVGVPPAHACAEGRELGLVDPHGSTLT